MGLIDNPLSSVLEKVLAHHSLRHDVIASNIANANTPGYTAFDLALRTRLDEAAPLLVRTSDSRHMSSERLDESGSRLQKSRAPAGLPQGSMATTSPSNRSSSSSPRTGCSTRSPSS